MQSGTDTWGWKHVSVFGEFDKGSGTKRWMCNHCNLRYNGSYSRVRAHLLGFTGVGINSCPAVDAPLRESFHVLEEGRVAWKRKRVSGSERPVKRNKNSQLRVAMVSKEDADDVVARFVFANGLNPSVVNSPYFRDLIKVTTSYGPSYKPPTADELCDSFLSKEKARLERSLALVRESWPQTGCSLLCVGSSDRKLRCIQICIFVSSPRGLMFLKAFDIDEFNEVENRFVDILTDVITGVGPANLLQIILRFDNANKLSNSLDLVLTKFPHVFLSRCTSDSIRMLMEEIAAIDWIKAAIVCSKKIEQCISKYQSFAPDVFSHSLNGNSDTMVSRFAPFFEMVKRVYELKEPLKEAVVSDKWTEWKESTSEDIGDTEAAILGDMFWSTAELLLQSVEPFVRLLSILNMDSFVIGDVCNWRAQTLKELTNKGIKGGRVNQIEELIVKRWDELFSPLHSASYILNPQYFGNAQAKDKIVMRGWKATLERYESDSSNRRVLREELSSYWRSQGSLGDEDAIDCRDKMDPVAWWENFGFEIPHLQTLAIKVLSQVSSATMCKEICQDKGLTCRETVKCLGVERVEDLVYVQNNLRIHCQKNGSRNGNEALALE